jgi:hypothetical protein
VLPSVPVFKSEPTTALTFGQTKPILKMNNCDPPALAPSRAFSFEGAAKFIFY